MISWAFYVSVWLGSVFRIVGSSGRRNDLPAPALVLGPDPGINRDLSRRKLKTKKPCLSMISKAFCDDDMTLFTSLELNPYGIV